MTFEQWWAENREARRHFPCADEDDEALRQFAIAAWNGALDAASLQAICTVDPARRPIQYVRLKDIETLRIHREKACPVCKFVSRLIVTPVKGVRICNNCGVLYSVS